jgi:hypothetical protein
VASFRPSYDGLRLENHESFQAISGYSLILKTKLASAALFRQPTAHTHPLAGLDNGWRIDTSTGFFCCPINQFTTYAIVIVTTIDQPAHLHSDCIVTPYLFIQQNETQRGFPLPHGDRFVGLGLSTLPCTLLCYECQYEPSNTAVVIVMPCR